MKEGLKNYNRRRMRFTAKIERFGSRSGWRAKKHATLLLTDVRNRQTGERIVDHVWMIAGVWSRNLRTGDVIDFEARVTRYTKGYKGYREEFIDERPVEDDYRLERPSKVRVTKKGGA